MAATMAVMFAIWTPAVANAQGTGAAWPQFRGSPALTGVAAAALPSSLEVLWSYQAADLIESSAAIVDGTVYVAAGNGDLLALDLATGALRWKYAGGEISGESSPAVHQGLVYFGDLAGTVHAVRTRDGTKVWTFATEGEVRSSPVVAQDAVLIGSYDTHLYALDAESGKLRWKVQTEGQVHGTPAVLGDVAFITGCDMIFRAIRIKDGRQMYTIEAGAYTAASPVVDRTRAYFGTFNEEVLALDLTGRQVAWRYSDTARRFPYYSSAALAGGRLYIGGRDKRVHALDVGSGKAVWTFETRARVDSSPVVAGGRVYVGSSDGRLYVLDAATGQKVWEFDAGDALTASPAIAGGRLVIGAHNGVIYCLG